MFESYIRGVFYYNYSSCHQLHTVALSFLLIFTVRISRAAITKVEFDAKGFAEQLQEE